MKKIDLKDFQSRAYAIQQFDLLLNKVEEIKIIAYCGFSGIGKSALLTWLKQNKCDKDKIPNVLVDFSLSRNEVFTAAFMETIIEKFKSLIPSNEFNKFTKRKRELIDTLIESASNVQQVLVNSSSNQVEVNKNLQKNIQIAKSELANIFSSCIKNTKSDVIVIFLDSFERLSVSNQEYIWDLLNKLVLDIPKLRIVIATQHLLSRSSNNLRKLDLPPLSKADSNILLKVNGIYDEKFHNIVYEKLAEGNLQITEFAIEAWNQAISKGKKLELGTVPQLIDQDKEEKIIEWIYQNIIDYIDEPIKNIVHDLVILRRFNLEIINALNDQTLDRHYIYNNLYNLSFIKNIKEEKKYHAFTKHFRLILLYAYYKEEPSKFQDRHSRAYELFKKKGDLINAIYHLFFVDKDQAIEEWNINRRKAKDEMDFSFVDSLFEIVESDEIGLAISNTDKALILTKKAHYLRQIGNLNDSQKAYEEALKLYQSNGFTEDVVKTHHGYAVLLALQEKYDDARSRLNTLLQFNPNDTYSINMLASLEVSNNHYERARDLLKKSRQINPENLFVINFSAQIELDTENWKSAIDYLEEANKIFPYETSILQKLAKAYTGRSNALLKQVRSISAKDEVQQHHRKTLIYEFLTFADGGQITEARSTFRKILSLDSSFSDILERWARSEQTKRNYKKASVFYEIYLDYNPRDSKVLFSYGWLKNAKYGRKERYRARELFKKSLEINPKRPEAWFYLGEVERLDKNFNEAANCYREAYTPWEADDGYYISIDGYNGEDDDQYDEIEIDSEDSKMVYKILWHWSKIEYKLGNFDKGRELYKKLHRIAFSHCKCRVLTRWAISEYECQNYEKGDSHLSSAIDCCDNVENQCSTITYLEAELSPLAGKPTAQSQQIARSMAQYSFHKIIGNIVLSRLYRKSNRQEEAKEILNNLLDEFPKNSNLLSEIEHFQGNSINTIN